MGWECSSLCSTPASLLLPVSSDIIRFWTTNDSGPIPRIPHPPYLYYPQSHSHTYTLTHTLRLIYKSISWRSTKCTLHLLYCSSPAWHIPPPSFDAGPWSRSLPLLPPSLCPFYLMHLLIRNCALNNSIYLNVFSCLSWFNLLMDPLPLCSLSASTHQAFCVSLV